MQQFVIDQRLDSERMRRASDREGAIGKLLEVK
jgi:hypothetical protein